MCFLSLKHNDVVASLIKKQVFAMKLGAYCLVTTEMSLYSGTTVVISYRVFLEYCLFTLHLHCLLLLVLDNAVQRNSAHGNRSH